MWSSSTCRSHGRGCRSRCPTPPGRSGASRSVPPRTTKPPESVYYERRGRTDGAAPPVLFLHGLGSSAADWAPQLGPFGERYRLLLVDLPGHWRSALPRERLTIEAMAERVDALLDQLDTPPAHVVGLSLGGSVGLELALRAPARVRSLTLVNAFARLGPPDAASGLRMLARLAPPGVPGALAPARARVPTRAQPTISTRIALASLAPHWGVTRGSTPSRPPPPRSSPSPAAPQRYNRRHVARPGAGGGAVPGAPQHRHEAPGPRARRVHQRLGALRLPPAVGTRHGGPDGLAHPQARLLRLVSGLRRLPDALDARALQGAQARGDLARHLALEGESPDPARHGVGDDRRAPERPRRRGRAPLRRGRLPPQRHAGAHLAVGAFARARDRPRPALHPRCRALLRAERHHDQAGDPGVQHRRRDVRHLPGREPHHDAARPDHVGAPLPGGAALLEGVPRPRRLRRAHHAEPGQGLHADTLLIRRGREADRDPLRDGGGRPLLRRGAARAGIGARRARDAGGHGPARPRAVSVSDSRH